MKKIFSGIDLPRFFALVGIILVFGAAFIYGANRYRTLAEESIQTKVQFVFKTIGLETTIRNLDKKLTEATGENANLRGGLLQEKQRNDSLAEQVSGIKGTVETLDKLSKTDPELLQKYSKVYFLNENYIPIALSSIDERFLEDPNKKLQIHAQVFPFLQKLFVASEASGVNLRILSAYRSFGEQSVLKSSYNVTYGAGSANQFSADQGYSEHQLGAAVDFTTVEGGSALSKFEASPAYPWLLENAYKYGFVLSYPKNNAYYIFEPWHWRFVGVELATKIHNEQSQFYSFEQRMLDQYLIKIFD